jgi:hypothetical protein
MKYSNLCCSPQRQSSVEAVFAIDDVQHLEVFEAELAWIVDVISRLLCLPILLHLQPENSNQ